MKRVRRGRPAKGWKARFLERLAATCNVRAACVAAGVGRSTLYRTRAKDEAFNEAVLDALDDAADALEWEARRRAVDGVERVHFQQITDKDGKTTTVETRFREYSDRLLMFLLCAARPEKYRERYDLKRIVAAIAAANGRDT